MFCKKSFSRILLSLFAFNALNGVVFTSALENDLNVEFFNSALEEVNYLDYAYSQWANANKEDKYNQNTYWEDKYNQNAYWKNKYNQWANADAKKRKEYKPSDISKFYKLWCRRFLYDEKIRSQRNIVYKLSEHRFFKFWRGPRPACKISRRKKDYYVFLDSLKAHNELENYYEFLDILKEAEELKYYIRFLNLLEQHKKLFNDCGIILKEDIKVIYDEIFKAIFENLCLNEEYAVSDGILKNSKILDTILRNYTNLPKPFSSSSSAAFYSLSSGSGHSYDYPIYRYNKKTKKKEKIGYLVFSIETRKFYGSHDSYLYSVDLKFEPKI